MDETFLAALRERGIPDANLEKMSQDKVTLNHIPTSYHEMGPMHTLGRNVILMIILLLKDNLRT